MNFIKNFQPKVLVCSAWNQICAVDENFFAWYIFMCNAGFSLIMQFSRWTFGYMNGFRYALFRGSYSDALSDAINIWPLFGGINLIIWIVGALMIIRQKIINEKVINPVINNPIFNNMAHNKPILNTRQAFISMFILLSLLSWIALKKSYHTIMLRNVLIIPLYIYIIFPISVIFGRMKFTKFILREVQHFCVKLGQYIFD